MSCCLRPAMEIVIIFDSIKPLIRFPGYLGSYSLSLQIFHPAKWKWLSVAYIAKVGSMLFAYQTLKFPNIPINSIV